MALNEGVLVSELRLMFSLLDRVIDGISPMLQDFEDHIINQGLADMTAAADTITTVRLSLLHSSQLLWI